MGDRQIVATCLSVDKHDDNVLNVCLHYFGCLKYSERIDYFESLNEIDKNLIRDRERRINNVKEFMKRDEDTIPPLNALANSLRIFRTFPKVVLPHSHNASGTKPVHRSSDGMSARMVLFRNSEPFTDEKYPQEWPDQKLPLGDLLRNTANGSNPLARHWSDNDNAIQWFHLPSNNMEWVEVCKSDSSRVTGIDGNNRKQYLDTMVKRLQILAFQGRHQRHGHYYTTNFGAANSREVI